MNRIFAALILSPEFAAEAALYNRSPNSLEHRASMIEFVNQQARAIGIVPDAEDRELQQAFISGELDNVELAKIATEQLNSALRKR